MFSSDTHESDHVEGQYSPTRGQVTLWLVVNSGDAVSVPALIHDGEYRISERFIDGETANLGYRRYVDAETGKKLALEGTTLRIPVQTSDNRQRGLSADRPLQLCAALESRWSLYICSRHWEHGGLSRSRRKF
jgi:hypothetical protein